MLSVGGQSTKKYWLVVFKIMLHLSIYNFLNVLFLIDVMLTMQCLHAHIAMMLMIMVKVIMIMIIISVLCQGERLVIHNGFSGSVISRSISTSTMASSILSST